MLYAVTQLSQYRIGYICRILCNKVNTNTLTANQSDHLFNLNYQTLGCIGK